MLVTIEYLKDLFDKCNKEYFNGELQTPYSWQITKTKNVLACVWSHRHYHADKKPYRVYTFKFSNYYDRSESDLLETMVHEQCHLYVRQNLKIGSAEESPHGPTWQAVAAEKSAMSKGKFTISRTADCSDCEKGVDADRTINIGAYYIQDKKEWFLFGLSSKNINHIKVYLGAMKEMNPRVSKVFMGVVKRKYFASITLCQKNPLYGKTYSDSEWEAKVVPNIEEQYFS